MIGAKSISENGNYNPNISWEILSTEVKVALFSED